MTLSSVRWGVLGTARINRRLLPAMRAASRSAVVAVASRDPARAEAYAREWHIPVSVAGYAALLTREDIDAIYLPLPNALHVEWTMKAVAAGKHVLCEKPLALCPEDVDRIRAVAEAAGVVVEEGFMYRHEEQTAAVVRLVRDGTIGAIRHVSSGFTYTQSRADDVRLDASLGGGALLDIGCYPVSYACLLAGRDPSSALGAARQTPSGVDEEFTGVLRFPGGITTSVYASFRASYRTWLEVTGSEGWLRVVNPFKPGVLETVEYERMGERGALEVTGSPMPFLGEVEQFVAAVLDRTPPAVSLAESRRVALALQMLARATAETPS